MELLLMFLVSVAPASAPANAPAARMEAYVYYSSYDELVTKLGSLLGEMDICSHVDNQAGRSWLIVDTDSSQLRAIRAAGLETRVTWPDIRDKFRLMTGCNPDDGSFRDFGLFFNYWEMRDTTLHLAQRYPDITAIDTSMRSFRNKALWCLKISDNPDSNEHEPQVFINAAIHAREPMGTHTCIGFASAVCRDYGHDSLVTWLVNNREIYIVPVQNPDGYVYNSDSGGTSSNWRKNRNNTSPRTGPGVDLNRNYGYKWAYDDYNSSPTPSNEVYRGPSRFSEPESQAFRDFQAAHKFRTEMDFHTYGRSNMYPWGYAAVTPPDVTVLAEMCDTLHMYNGYSSAQASGVNGVSFDWEYSDTLWNGVRKFVTYAFTSELGINDFWYGSTDSAYIAAEVMRNVPNCYYLTRVAGVWLEPLAVFVNDTAQGNSNGKLDPGEAATVWFRLRSRAVHPLDTALSVTAVMLPSDTLVQVLTPTAVFPAIPRRSTADNHLVPFSVQCSPDIAPNETVAVRLEVTFLDDSVTIMQPLNYRIIIGSAPVAIGAPTPAPRPLAPVLRAFPNPAHDRVTFFSTATSHHSPATNLEVYSANGRLVRTIVLGRGEGPTVAWDMRDSRSLKVAPGVYFVRQVSEGRVGSARLVVE
jgi:hypothetical protein